MALHAWLPLAEPLLYGRPMTHDSWSDPVLSALIASEEKLDAHYADWTSADFAVGQTRIADGEGGEIVIYGDGSWCLEVDGRVC